MGEENLKRNLTYVMYYIACYILSIPLYAFITLLNGDFLSDRIFPFEVPLIVNVIICFIIFITAASISIIPAYMLTLNKFQEKIKSKFIYKIFFIINILIATLIYLAPFFTGRMDNF